MTMQRFGIVLLLLTVFSGPAWALRCGNLLVDEGDHMLDVLDKCGEPEFRDRRTAVKGQRLRHPYGALIEERFEEIEIEEWVYNFGPRRFKQHFRFENGLLVEIRSLQRGD